jgi:GGDEF domain-containing protein
LIAISERVRSMVDSAYRLTAQGELHVTVSIGAVGADQRDSAASLLLKAERCLYASRTQGRNRVTIHGLQTEKADGT